MCPKGEFDRRHHLHESSVFHLNTKVGVHALSFVGNCLTVAQANAMIEIKVALHSHISGDHFAYFQPIAGIDQEACLLFFLPEKFGRTCSGIPRLHLDRS